MITLLGYIGSLFMVAFAFTMVTELAIVGLSLMTMQAARAGLWNFVILNLISIVGFASNL
ncbi:hypothetical protein N9M52_00720 [bacterium]|nr:hypothetical protein [bacterium]